MATLGSKLHWNWEEKEEKVCLYDALRMRLVVLCQAHHIWLAGWMMYLENENGRFVCKDTKTGQEKIILWQSQEYILEFDLEDRNQRDSSRLPVDLAFKVRKKWGEKQEFFWWAKILSITSEQLLHLLSEKSMKLEKVNFEEKGINPWTNNKLWWAQRILFWKRLEKDGCGHLNSQIITLTMNDGSRSKISCWNTDLSFSDLDEWNRWYPDFSDIYSSNITNFHGREYIEVFCWCSQTRKSKKHLLSRPEGFWNYEKHYINAWSNKFEVMHLVGHLHAKIKFLDDLYEVGVDEAGDMVSKQGGRYIHLSWSSTFWYDLKEHQKLEHEPA